MSDTFSSSWFGFQARTWGIVCIASLTALLLSAFMFRAYTTETRISREQSSRLQQAVAFSLWRYGVIESVDARTRSLVVSISQDFAPDVGDRSMRIRVEEDTVIGMQTLVGNNPYTGLSPVSYHSFNDLRPGMRVALVINNRTDTQTLVAQLILFGDPL